MLPIYCGIELPYRAIKSNIADSLDLLIHIERGNGKRYVQEVLEIEAFDTDSDKYQFKTIFENQTGGRHATD